MPAPDVTPVSATEAYINAAAPAGSALYYACLLGAAGSCRQELLAWHALEQEFLKSITEIEDPGVARLRLDWWREEIERAALGRARHPLVQTLQSAIQTQRLPEAMAGGAITALQDALGLPDRNEPAALERDYRQYYGPLWQCSARLAGIVSESALAAAGDLGALHHQFRALLGLPQTLTRGQHRPLAATTLTTAGVNIGQSLDTSAWRNLLTLQFHQLPERMEQANRSFPSEHAPAFLHGLILIRLDRALAAEIARDHALIGSHVYTLTPIRRLWLAWRCRRQVLKRRPN